MAIDPNIPLRVQALDLSQVGENFSRGYQTGLKKRELEQQQKDSELKRAAFEEQTAQNRFNNLEQREQSRIKSTIIGAAQLNSYLENNDIEGARNFLNQRKQNLQNRMAMGENIDTTQTDEALQLLDQDPQQLRNLAQSNIKVGQQLGLLSKPEKEKPLVLGEGQIAYDAQGNVIAKGSPKSKKESAPLPVAALKLQQEALDKIGTSSIINSSLDKFLQQLEKGDLKLGVVENELSESKNYLGKSDTNSRNYASFISSMEKLRNDSLRLNNGVQTEGDAQRAWNELFKNINDQEAVKQRLKEIKEINEKGKLLQQYNVDTVRSNFGAEQFDFSKYNQVDKGSGDQNIIDFSSLK